MRLAVALVLIAAAAPARAQSRPSDEAAAATAPKPDPERDRKFAWFRQARFGMMIHWGLYSVPAGEWKGKPIAGIGEWIMNRARIPISEYELLARSFNPVKFDAKAWVQLAKDAGMKYMVITSK